MRISTRRSLGEPSNDVESLILAKHPVGLNRQPCLNPWATYFYTSTKSIMPWESVHRKGTSHIKKNESMAQEHEDPKGKQSYNVRDSHLLYPETKSKF